MWPKPDACQARISRSHGLMTFWRRQSRSACGLHDCWETLDTFLLIVVYWLESNHSTASFFFAPLPASTYHWQREACTLRLVPRLCPGTSEARAGPVPACCSELAVDPINLACRSATAMFAKSMFFFGGARRDATCEPQSYLKPTTSCMSV